MFANVYLLRAKGERLPRERLVCVPGRLRIERGFVGSKAQGLRVSMTASLHTIWPQPFPGHSYATLYGARVTRMDERGFIIVGSEVILDGGSHKYLQAWACVPTIGVERPQAAGSSR